MQGKIKIPAGSLVIWKKGNTWKGHIGIVKSWNKGGGITIEGNTSAGITGSQSNGDGVYKRARVIQQYSYFRITHFTII